MNVHSSNTTAAGAARDPAMPLGKTQISIDLDALRNADMQELWLLRSGLHTIANVVCGLMWNPQFGDDAGGMALASLNEFICTYESAVVNVAKASRATDKRDVEWRNWIIVGSEADCTDDLPSLAVTVAEAICAEAAAAFEERRSA